MRKELIWYVGFSKTENTSPERRVIATVPGAVQLDFAKAEGWENYTCADNYKDYSWMEDVYWSYSTKLDFSDLNQDERLFFVCKGVDYRFKVKLDKQIIHDQEGMFTPFEVDLTDISSPGDELEILIYPAPKRVGALPDRTQADQCCKPAVSYGWDWHPRLIPLGIWDETYLEARPAYHIKNCEVTYDINENLSHANVQLRIQFSNAGQGKIVWRFFDRCLNLVYETEKPVDTRSSIMDFNLENPELWWPNGQGEQVLYSSVVELYDCKGSQLSKFQSRIGFRTIKLVMHPGAWDSSADFPKTRCNPPVTLEINGRQIFCKGSNWVNLEIFPGIITEDTYKPLVKMAKEANMNIFRSWGGGIINKESFFDLCDENGILVWQEFPLACNNYIGTPAYLKVLDQESRSIIKRLRSHACLAIWCGGNELFNSWSGMTDQSLTLRLLDRNCFDLDPKTPFIMTSPLSGMGHGHYLFRSDDGKEVFERMQKASNTAYTEFGCPGPSPAEYLKRFIPEDELYPPRPGTSWEAHHAFRAWEGNTWLTPETVEYYFGPSNTLEELVERGQLLQSEGYKSIFEEARRQKPVCSMALNWCYNEPWPTAANNSIINWPAEPKPGFYAVKAACRPVLASARIPKFQWNEGEVFSPELWVLNDSPSKLPVGRIEVFLKFADEEIFLLAWDYPELEPNINIPGPVIRFPLPSKKSDRMILVLKAVHDEEMNSEYTLLYKTKEISNNCGTRILNT